MPGQHVFISHAPSDDVVVRKIREALEPRVKLWIDNRQLAAGDAVDPEVRAAIDEADHLIAVLSLEALVSDWVKNEVAYAREVRARRNDGFRIIPMLVAPLEPKHAKWLFEKDTVVVPLANVPGGFDRAVAELFVLANDTARGKSFVGETHLQDWFVPVLYQEEVDPPLITELQSEQVQRVVKKRRELALGNLPQEPGHRFVGRSRELLALERLLARERYAVVLGEGGEGKTTLAAELARWLVATRRFARAAFVSLEDALDDRTVLFALGDQLVAGFTAEAAKEPEKAEQLVVRVLREQATIIVLDNVETVLPPPSLALERGGLGGGSDLFDPEVLGKILDLCARLGQAGDTHLVFTSREGLPDPFDQNVVRIGRLDRGKAMMLVGNVLGEEGARPRSTDAGDSEDEIDRLVDAVDCHALSLVLVAREVSTSGVRGTPKRLEELMASMAERDGDNRERSLYASVELSLRRLPKTTQRRLPRLGVFQGGGSVFVIAQVLELGDDPQAAFELARQIVAVGLGELLGYGHLRLHPALGPLLRRELDKAEREAARRAWVRAMMGLGDFLRQEQSQDAQLATTLTILELPNLLAALEHLQKTGGAEEVVSFATTIEGLLRFLDRRRAMDRVVLIREAAAQGLGKWTRARFNVEGAAVDRLLDDGRFADAVEAARAVLRRASAAGERAYEEAAYDLAVAHFRLACALRMSGAVEAALGPLAEARAHFHKLTGGGAARMAMKCLSETGVCLRALGRLDEAAAAFEASIRLAEELNDRRSGAVARGNLGTVHMHQNRIEDALSAHTEARKTFEQLGEPGSVAIGWHQISRVCKRAGKLKAAEHACHQALKIRVQCGDRSGESETLDQLGLLYNDMGRAEDSVRFHRQAAEIRIERRDLMKEGHSRSNAAIVLIQLQRYDEARQEILRAIECAKPYGDVAQPWKTFSVLYDLERALGTASAAEKARDDAIASFLAYRRAGGENHGRGGQLAAGVAEAVASGETAGVASQLAEVGAHPELPERFQALVPVLREIIDGSRDPALASTPELYYTDAVEVTLLLERLG